MSLFDGLFAALRRLFSSPEQPQPVSEIPAMPLEVPKDTVPVSLLDEATREAARFLTENPLYTYRSDAGELNVVMVGESDLRSAFFSAVFAAAQMLDTQMNIHILAPDAESFCHQLIAKAPALPHVCNITVNGKKRCAAGAAQTLLLGDNAPLANLTFRDTAELPSAENILELNPGCVLLMDDEPALAAQLAAQSGGKLLIGIARDSLDPVILPEAGQDVHVAPFIFAADFTEDFYAEVRSKALAVHSFYTLEFNQRATKAEIENSFLESYNFRSSLRSALSIPYKLFACGLTEKTEDVSGKFTRQVLENPDKTLLSRLIWLEHRSWQAFMIMEGWQLLPEEEYGKVLFDRDNPSHSYKKVTFGGKWHPCLCASRDDGKYLPLDSWSNGGKAPECLDPLDRCSIKIHQCFVSAAKDPANPRYHTSSIEKLLRELAGGADEETLPYVRELENVTHRVLNEDPGSDRLWKKLYKALYEKLDEKQKLRQKMDALAEKMDVRLRSMKPRDFKHSDLDVIEAIPMILQEHPVLHIYKLFSQNNWENVISAASMRPDRLTLVTDGGDIPQTDLDACKRFLTARGLEHVIVEQSALQNISGSELRGVLDITGASAAQLLNAIKNEYLHSLPVVEYRDGKVCGQDEKVPDLSLYRNNNTLSVKDVLTINDARVLSDREEGHLLGMGENAVELWSIAQSASENGRPYYNTFCTLIKSYCMPDTAIYKSENIRKSVAFVIPSAERQNSGMDAVLGELDYCTVTRDGDRIRVTARNDLWQGGYNDALEAMQTAISNNTNPRSFQLVKIPNPLYQPGRPASSDNSPLIQIVRDNCLEYRLCLKINPSSEPYVEDSKGDVRYSVKKMESLLEKLQSAGMLLPLDGNKTVYLESRDGRSLYLNFAFASPAVRECLTKEGNVQEAFVYRVIRDMDLFDDLKLSVSIAWGEENGDATTNEIDLIGTKGNRSYFISCKKCKELTTEQLTEIRYETDRFGIDGVPILIATAKDDLKNHARYARAKRMGVHIITLQDYLRDDGAAEDSAEVLQAKLCKIVKES